MKVILSEMTREEVRHLAKPETVVVIPTASTEQHGPHLPLEVDFRIVTEVVTRAASAVAPRVPIVVAPTVPFGRSAHHMDRGPTLTLDDDTFKVVVRQLCDSLTYHGFRKIVIINGHGGNDRLVKAVAEELAGGNPALAIYAASYWTMAQDALAAPWAKPAQPIPGHAGTFETCCMLALRPDLVDTSGIQPNEVPFGISDNPLAASAELGERLLAVIVQEVAGFLVKFAEAPK